MRTDGNLTRMKELERSQKSQIFRLTTNPVAATLIRTTSCPFAVQAMQAGDMHVLVIVRAGEEEPIPLPIPKSCQILQSS